jgi:hypothetical protein
MLSILHIWYGERLQNVAIVDWDFIINCGLDRLLPPMDSFILIPLVVKHEAV